MFASGEWVRFQKGGLIPMIAHWLDYLLHGSDTLMLPKTWLEDRERLARYEAWTRRENESWVVSKDTAATARERFWQRMEAKRQPAANVTTFRAKTAR